MEALYRAALASLESLPAVRAMPDKPAGRLRSPEITVSLERWCISIHLKIILIQ